MVAPFSKVMMSHGDIVVSRTMELGYQVQPNRHFMTTIMTLHLRFHRWKNYDRYGDVFTRKSKMSFKKNVNRKWGRIKRERKLTNGEVLLSASLVLFPRESAISRFLLGRAVIHRFDFVRLVRIAGLGEIREEREDRLCDSLILARIIPRKEGSSSHQWQPEDIRYILAANAAQTLEQNDFLPR